MFNHKPKTLEALAHRYSVEEIATFAAFVSHIQEQKYTTLTPEQLCAAQEGFSRISELQTDRKHYAFHVDDSYAERNDEGVVLYLRLGNTLKPKVEYWSRDEVTQVKDVLKYTSQQNISTIFTGPISENGFLGLEQMFDEAHPITYRPLTEYEISQFADNGIHVEVLSQLC